MHNPFVVTAVAAAAMLGALAACNDKTAASATDATPTSAATEVISPLPVADEDVDPPAAVVPEDPAIPLNEAVVGTPPVAADYFADAAPPEPVVEDSPPKPEPGNIWIPGYWWWSRPLARYVWITGAWRNAPPDQIWYPGSWIVSSPGRYAWSPGYWAPRDFVRETIELAPPPMRVESFGPRPGAEYVWTSGYYAYRDGSYVWVVGSWLRPPTVGLGWIEPRYISCGGRYCFQPGRWDYAPAARGTVYMPNVSVRAGAHVSPAPAPHAVVAAHATFVTAAAKAVAHGAVPSAGGGVAGHGGAGGAHGGGGAGEAHGGAGGHGGGAPANEGHTGGAGNEGHTGGAGNEGHAGGGGNAPGEGHGGGASNEPHAGGTPASEPHGGSHEPPPAHTAPGGGEHGGAPASPHANPPPAAPPHTAPTPTAPPHTAPTPTAPPHTAPTPTAPPHTTPTPPAAPPHTTPTPPAHAPPPAAPAHHGSGAGHAEPAH